MRPFLAAHADTAALAGAVVLAILIIAGYAASITVIAGTLDMTLDPEAASAPAPSFDFEAARKLDLKGNVPAR